MVENNGYTFIKFKNGFVEASLRDFEKVKHFWMNSADSFIEVAGMYGERIVIKRADVVYIVECTPEIKARIDEDNRERELKGE